MSKKYVFTKQQGVVLENYADTNQFVMDNTRKFSDYNIFSNKNETIKLLNDVIDMCENEIQNSEFVFSDIEDVDHYNYNLSNEQIVYFTNYTNVLGQIYFNIFDQPDIRLKQVEDGVCGAISTSSLLRSAYNELIDAKASGRNTAYGATLIFATLIENELKGRIKLLVFNEKIQELKAKMDANEITMSVEDIDLYHFLTGKNSKLYNSIYACGEGFIELLERYGITLTGSEKDILKGFKTLNQLVGTIEFERYTNQTFRKTMQILFSTKKLNLRNDLAHSNSTYKNYYHLNVTALLYGILCIINKEFYLA